MATKTKGTNAKIKELKGIKPEKVTEDQLKKIQTTINGINRAQIELGQMEIQKHEMVHDVARLRDSITTIQAELQEEYGTFDIDINDGTINYEQHSGEVNTED
jgi:hypothetical protein